MTLSKSKSPKATSKGKQSKAAATTASSPAPKTVLDKIVFAIRNQPAPSSKGISRIAICKFLKSEFQLDKQNAIKAALKKGVDKNILMQTGQSFRVQGDPVIEDVEEEKLQMEDLKVAGKEASEEAKDGDLVTVKYVGKLENGYQFDAASSFSFVLGAGDVIKGWDQGVKGMKIGGQRKLVVPSKLGYGKRGCAPDIPPNATLHFVVTLKKIQDPSSQNA